MDISVRFILLFVDCILSAHFITALQVSNHETSENLHQEDLAPKFYTLADQLKEYWKCYRYAAKRPKDHITGKPFCPANFDGFACWAATSANETVRQLCPQFISSSSHNKYATRKCSIDGKWVTNVITEETGADYSQCPHDILLETDQELLLYLFGEFDKISVYSPEIIYDLEQCIDDVLSQPRPENSDKYCLRTFDGWGCWNDTPAGENAYIHCPVFMLGFFPERFAHKYCDENATWYRHPDTNTSWSNYSTCVDINELQLLQKINTFHVAGYSISLLAVTISLIIFCYFKSLQCIRITIHKNLFLSYIFNNIMWITWYTSVVHVPDVLLGNTVGCQILHVLVQYFLTSNYFWMLCEGLYLHMLLVVTFVSEKKLMKWFYCLGWGLPALIVIPYAAVRIVFPEHSRYCWVDKSVYLWIIAGPVCASLILNLVFLINIVHVLVTKLTAVNSAESHHIRKTVRATLILIPLLGLQYFLIPFRPKQRSYAYEIISAIVSSFQGLCVAILFCFFNKEVITALKREWYLKNMLHENGKRRISSTSATTFFSTVRRASTPNQKSLLPVS